MKFKESSLKDELPVEISLKDKLPEESSLKDKLPEEISLKDKLPEDISLKNKLPEEGKSSAVELSVPLGLINTSSPCTYNISILEV